MSASFSKLIKRPHLGSTRMLGYALTLQDYDAWEGASAVWQARLTETERAALAWAALRSLDEDHAREVAYTVIQGAGAPLPPFISPMDEASFWADIASESELKAYALACFNRLSKRDQRAFLSHVREAA